MKELRVRVPAPVKKITINRKAPLETAVEVLFAWKSSTSTEPTGLCVISRDWVGKRFVGASRSFLAVSHRLQSLSGYIGAPLLGFASVFGNDL
jgi:hypothetical protein